MMRTNTDRLDQLTRDAVATVSRVDNLEQQTQKDFKEVRESLARQENSVTDSVARLEERITSLEPRLAVLADRDAAREKELTKLRDELTKERDSRQRLEVEVSALKQQLADHIKQTDLADSRRWALIVLLLGAVLSLASGLIVTLAKK